VFDAPLDAWYTWLGVAVTATALLGVALALPAGVPPDAGRAAAAVDRVAASPHAATATLSLDAEAVRLEPAGLALRNAAGTAHATLRHGPVRWAGEGTALGSVLAGARPGAVFTRPAGFLRALADARDRSGDWHAVDGPLRIRHVVWGGTDVTLVG
jgi:hypothetical protein